MLKKIVVATLVVCLASALLSVGVQAEKTTIRFWSNVPSDNVVTWWDEQIQIYEKEYPEVEVKAEFLDGDSLKTKLEAALAAGTEPDLFFTLPGARYEEYVKAGLLLPLDGLLDADRFSDGAIKGVTVNGKIQSMPLNVNPCVIWTNNGLFETVGIDPPYQPTWSEFLDITGKIKAADYIPIALGNGAQWTGLFYYWALNTRLGGSEAVRDALSREGSFLDASFIRAGEYAQELAKADAFPIGFNGIDYQFGNGLFVNSEAAMIYMGPWLMGVVASQAPEDFQLGYMRFPTLPDGKPGAETAIMGGMSVIAVSARTENADAAIDFLNLFASDVERAADFVNRTGMLSPLKGIPIPDPPTLSFRLVKEFDGSSDVYNWWDQFLPPSISQQLLDLSQPLLASEITPLEFAEKMEKATTDHLAREAG